ncbi:RHS repeat-associated core domain-containing protein [Xanthomonas rydalmerensis]|uniref:RHS repeat-associated core domain-containing protein n=1 Tax=Xanthomonas rydalmerensis TaxID=3046274 RepID=A0ABZ0JI61_9XANT|nr:RHS repeat-associated core domain-containing protein [Xanthomonas sp. DM-2023]WOS39488.1 RHS repeat-associated core domain-containing protein [Xanthomonas sp. DM-2023]WOS43672.1 RHS repeat-associated core domain-containing protein [Xanthomonas sp. DM-2023]WOS47853.1 RHS repeat-associated core domain-containing protein [Xanthomonas sp. DM-2023]WOS52031.1 RHS repeat-associated core domain-containing protein [Xanthomonas sp. DM-2023]WOS56215.1 RHS repeat-associated core domain-containing prote
MSNFQGIRAALRLMATVALSLFVAFGVSAQTVRYIHTDGLGSVVLVTDKDRNVLERREYEPYGSVVSQPVMDGPGYTGHVMDAATGLTYMQQRYYDPAIGLFLSVDPVAPQKSDFRHFNRYVYAFGNPYLFSDPDGRDPYGCGDYLRCPKIVDLLAVKVAPSGPAANAAQSRFSVVPKGSSVSPLKAKGFPYVVSVPNGVLQVGIHASVSALAATEAGVGFAADTNGGVGTYSTAAYGAGPSEDANLSVVVTWSNASTINQLAGGGTSANVGGGMLGHASLGGGVSDASPGSPTIYSGSLSVGLGAGAGGTAMHTETQIYRFGD